MKIKPLILKIVLTLLVLSIYAFGQTPDSPANKYGRMFNAYEIRPGVMLRIRKDNQGQITEMRVERFSGTEGSIHLDKTIDAYLVKEIIDELLPAEERGNQGQSFGLTLIVGASWRASYDYESVSIRLLGGTDTKKLQSQNRYRKDNPFQSAEVIIIKWKGR